MQLDRSSNEQTLLPATWKLKLLSACESFEPHPNAVFSNGHPVHTTCLSLQPPGRKEGQVNQQVHSDTGRRRRDSKPAVDRFPVWRARQWSTGFYNWCLINSWCRKVEATKKGQQLYNNNSYYDVASKICLGQSHVSRVGFGCESYSTWPPPFHFMRKLCLICCSDIHLFTNNRA